MNLSDKTLNGPGLNNANFLRIPSVICPELPGFDRQDLETVREAFSVSPVCALRQAWLEMEQPGFSPGVVRVGWRNESLLLFAELTDADICTWAADDGRQFWELGDLVEIFLRPTGQESYSEFHITPNNQQLQLRYDNVAMAENLRKTSSYAKARVDGQTFYSRTWINSGQNRWFVFAEISAAAVQAKTQPLAASEWLFSFSRYDYTRGDQKPVISSTSAHSHPDFHRQQEWSAMKFQVSPPGRSDPARPVVHGTVINAGT